MDRHGDEDFGLLLEAVRRTHRVDRGLVGSLQRSLRRLLAAEASHPRRHVIEGHGLRASQALSQGAAQQKARRFRLRAQLAEVAAPPQHLLGTELISKRQSYAKLLEGLLLAPEL